MSVKAFYPELFYFRKKVLKMEVEDVIKGIDMSKATYLRCENGKREFTLTEASIIAKNMNVSLKELFPIFFRFDVAELQQIVRGD